MNGARPGCEYTKLPEVITMAHVINVKNCVNIDIDPELTPEQENMYSGCIINHYEYSPISNDSLEEGDVCVGRTFRARLKGISTVQSKRSRFKKTTINSVTAEVNNWCARTSGVFICKISDIEIYERILVELFDPVTGESLNQHILNKYPDVLDVYQVNQKTRSDRDKWR